MLPQTVLINAAFRLEVLPTVRTRELQKTVRRKAFRVMDADVLEKVAALRKRTLAVSATVFRVLVVQALVNGQTSPTRKLFAAIGTVVENSLVSASNVVVKLFDGGEHRGALGARVAFEMDDRLSPNARMGSLDVFRIFQLTSAWMVAQLAFYILVELERVVANGVVSAERRLGTEAALKQVLFVLKPVSPKKL